MLPVKNLFVLYTGGTIGMLQTPQGLAPAGGFEARMRDHLQSLGDAPDLRWRFAELQPPLDSANMTQGNWLAMRDAIVAALDAGLLSAGGMTREAALGKLFGLLGAGLGRDEAQRWFALDLCGENAD